MLIGGVLVGVMGAVEQLYQGKVLVYLSNTRLAK